MALQLVIYKSIEGHMPLFISQATHHSTCTHQIPLHSQRYITLALLYLESLLISLPCMAMPLFNTTAFIIERECIRQWYWPHGTLVWLGNIIAVISSVLHLIFKRVVWAACHYPAHAVIPGRANAPQVVCRPLHTLATRFTLGVLHAPRATLHTIVMALSYLPRPVWV